jgi:hypothetical protein
MVSATSQARPSHGIDAMVKAERKPNDGDGAAGVLVPVA